MTAVLTAGRDAPRAACCELSRDDPLGTCSRSSTGLASALMPPDACQSTPEAALTRWWSRCRPGRGPAIRPWSRPQVWCGVPEDLRADAKKTGGNMPKLCRRHLRAPGSAWRLRRMVHPDLTSLIEGRSAMGTLVSSMHEWLCYQVRRQRLFFCGSPPVLPWPQPGRPPCVPGEVLPTPGGTGSAPNGAFRV